MARWNAGPETVSGPIGGGPGLGGLGGTDKFSGLESPKNLIPTSFDDKPETWLSWSEDVKYHLEFRAPGLRELLNAAEATREEVTISPLRCTWQSGPPVSGAAPSAKATVARSAWAKVSRCPASCCELWFHRTCTSTHGRHRVLEVRRTSGSHPYSRSN